MGQPSPYFDRTWADVVPTKLHVAIQHSSNINTAPTWSHDSCWQMQWGPRAPRFDPKRRSRPVASAPRIWNPYLEPWNLPKLYFRTFAGNLDRHLEPSRTYTLTWMEPIYALLGTSESSGTFTWNPCSEPRNILEPFMIGTLTWNLGTCRNLYLEPLYGTSEPSEPYLEPLLGTSEPAGTFTWNPYTWNLGTFGTLLGTLTWNLGTCRNLYLEPLLGTSEPAGTFTWNPYLEPRNLPEPLLGTSEPAGTFTWNPYLEPRNLPEPLLGTLTWNLGTCQNLAGWLPQSAPGLSLARTPKLSAVGEKSLLCQNSINPKACYLPLALQMLLITNPTHPSSSVLPILLFAHKLLIYYLSISSAGCSPKRWGSKQVLLQSKLRNLEAVQVQCFCAPSGCEARSIIFTYCRKRSGHWSAMAMMWNIRPLKRGQTNNLFFATPAKLRALRFYATRHTRREHQRTRNIHAPPHTWMTAERCVCSVNGGISHARRTERVKI